MSAVSELSSLAMKVLGKSKKEVNKLIDSEGEDAVRKMIENISKDKTALATREGFYVSPRGEAAKNLREFEERGTVDITNPANIKRPEEFVKAIEPEVLPKEENALVPVSVRERIKDSSDKNSLVSYNKPASDTSPQTIEIIAEPYLALPPGKQLQTIEKDITSGKISEEQGSVLKNKLGLGAIAGAGVLAAGVPSAYIPGQGKASPLTPPPTTKSPAQEKVEPIPEEKSSTVADALTPPKTDEKSKKEPSSNLVSKIKAVYDTKNAPKEYDPEQRKKDAETLAAKLQGMTASLPKEQEDAFNERLAKVDEALKQAEAKYEEDKNTTQWTQVAEKLGHALTQLGAGIYGAQTGQNLGNLQFDKTDWDKQFDRLMKERGFSTEKALGEKKDIQTERNQALAVKEKALDDARAFEKAEFEAKQRGDEEASRQFEAEKRKAEAEALRVQAQIESQERQTKLRTEAEVETARIKTGANLDAKDKKYNLDIANKGSKEVKAHITSLSSIDDNLLASIKNKKPAAQEKALADANKLINSLPPETQAIIEPALKELKSKLINYTREQQIEKISEIIKTKALPTLIQKRDYYEGIIKSGGVAEAPAAPLSPNAPTPTPPTSPAPKVKTSEISNLPAGTVIRKNGQEYVVQADGTYKPR